MIITRDNTTYELYKNVAKCKKGIDCAFWVNDAFDPRGFAKKKYDVVTFNRSKEPELFQNWPLPIIRPWHMQFSYKKDYIADGRLVSDTAFDYLTIYANANRVYTDLVHATIPSLTYGVPVKYWYIDKRSNAFFELVGLVDDNGYLSIDSQTLIRIKKDVETSIAQELAIQ